MALLRLRKLWYTKEITQGINRLHVSAVGMKAITRIDVLKEKKHSVKSARTKGTTKRHAEVRPGKHLQGTVHM